MSDTPLLDYVPPAGRFNGPEYVPAFDYSRLRGQQLAIWNFMKDGSWHTLSEIEDETGFPQASISAQLRHLRKPRFNSHIVDKRRRGDQTKGLFEYRVRINAEVKSIKK